MFTQITGLLVLGSNNWELQSVLTIFLVMKDWIGHLNFVYIAT